MRLPPTTPCAPRKATTLAVWVLVALAVVFGLQYAVAVVQGLWNPHPSLARGASRVVLAAVILVAMGPTPVHERAWWHWSVAVESLSRLHQRQCAEQGDTAARLLVATRTDGWTCIASPFVAWPHHLVAGTGAGTFSFTNFRFRDTALVVKHAHSQWLNVLSELGLVAVAVRVAIVCCLPPPFATSGGGVLTPNGRFLRPACGRARFCRAHVVRLGLDMAAATVAFLLLLAAVDRLLAAGAAGRACIRRRRVIHCRRPSRPPARISAPAPCVGVVVACGLTTAACRRLAVPVPFRRARRSKRAAG